MMLFGGCCCPTAGGQAHLWLGGFGGIVVGGSLWEKGWGVWSRGKRHRVGGVVTFCAENRGGPRRPAFCLGYTLPSFLFSGSGTNFLGR